MPHTLFRTMFLACLVVTSGGLGLVPPAGATDGPPDPGGIDAPAAFRSAGHPDTVDGADPVGEVATAVGAVAGDFHPSTLQAAETTRRLPEDRDPLDNEVRRAVYEAVRASPGTYLAEVAGEAGVSWSTVRYHARVLEAHDLVTAEKVRGRHRLYPDGDAEPALTAAVADPSTATLLAALSRLEPVGVSALAAELGVTPSTVTYHLQRLEADGLVVRERDGREVAARLEPGVRSMLPPADDEEVTED